jgi:hypothetical protein
MSIKLGLALFKFKILLMKAIPESIGQPQPNPYQHEAICDVVDSLTQWTRAEYCKGSPWVTWQLASYLRNGWENVNCVSNPTNSSFYVWISGGAPSSFGFQLIEALIRSSNVILYRAKSLEDASMIARGIACGKVPIYNPN